MKKFILFFCLSFVFLIFNFSLSVNAQGNNITQPSDPQRNNITQPSDPQSSCHDSSGKTILCNYLSFDTPQALIGSVINSILGLVGSIALLMFVYGGLTWMTSSGSQEKIKKGRDIIVWSAIGLAVIFASYGIVRVIISTVK